MRIRNTADDSKLRFDRKSMYLMLIACLVCLFACMVLIAGKTWAWYQYSQSVSIQPIRMSEFDIQVNIADENGYAINNTNYSEFNIQPQTTADFHDSEQAFYLDAGVTYYVTLNAVGTPMTSGYGSFSTGGEVYVTEQMVTGRVINITIIPSESGYYVFTSAMGKVPENMFVVYDNALLGSKLIDNNNGSDDNTGATESGSDNTGFASGEDNPDGAHAAENSTDTLPDTASDGTADE